MRVCQLTSDPNLGKRSSETNTYVRMNTLSRAERKEGSRSSSEIIMVMIIAYLTRVNKSLTFMSGLRNHGNKVKPHKSDDSII